MGTALPSMEKLYAERCLSRDSKIHQEHSHPANKYYDPLPSGVRLKTYKETDRITKSFYSDCVKQINSIKLWSAAVK